MLTEGKSGPPQKDGPYKRREKLVPTLSAGACGREGRQAEFFAAVLFGLGLLSVLGGIIAAMLELRGALHPVELETQFCPTPWMPGSEKRCTESGAVEAAQGRLYSA
jgi:hypothetical protein